MFVQEAVLAGKLLAVQSQLVVCTDAIEQKKAPRPKFTLSFRLLWIALSKWLPDWRKLAHVIQPATEVRWHRAGFRLYWRWKSRPGRPSVSRKMQALIRRLSRENSLWGAEHIREELAKLKYDPPCAGRFIARPWSGTDVPGRLGPEVHGEAGETMEAFQHVAPLPLKPSRCRLGDGLLHGEDAHVQNPLHLRHHRARTPQVAALGRHDLALPQHFLSLFALGSGNTVEEAFRRAALSIVAAVPGWETLT